MKRRSRRLVRTALLAVAVALLPAAELPAQPGAPGTPSLDWQALWGEILRDYTHAVPTTVGTAVDYRGLRGEPGAGRWRALLESLARAPEPSGRAERMAFWIDAYNVLAVDTVLGAWPVESIRDAGSLLWPVWRRDAGTAAGRAVTLHEIEHEILRPMGDPRIHAAIVCASTSCPSLRREPYRAATLDAQLDDAMRVWLASDTKGLRIDRPERRITVSRIFRWFEDDFDVLGGVRATVTRFAPERDRAWLEANAAGADLEHFDYDWTLNDWKAADAASTLGAP